MGYKFKLGLLSFGASLLPQMAAAQTAPQSTSADASPEIIVTAQKRAESLVNVPIAITAVSGQTLQNAGIANLSSLSHAVAGMNMSASGAHLFPVIRGIGTQVAGPGLAANIATYVDGIYRPNGNTSNIDFADVSGIQVLKGPQGTLYGQNATGGAIIIDSKKPEFTPSADILLSYGRFNEVTASLFATAPLSDKVAISAAVLNRSADGYIENVTTGEKVGSGHTLAARAKVLWNASEDLSFMLTYEHTHVDDPSAFIFSNYKGIATATLTPGAIVTSKPYQTSGNFPSIFVDTANNVILTTKLDLGSVELISYTAGQWEHNYGQYDVDGSSLTISHVNFPSSERTLSQEFQANSKGKGRFNWTAGVLLYEDLGKNELSVLNTLPAFKVLAFSVKTQSVSAFVDTVFEAVPHLFLTAGVRYSVDHLIEEFGSAPTFSPTNASTTFHALTPRAAVRYELGTGQSIYASYNRGYKVGAFNAGGLNTDPVEPEKNDAFEVGYKLNSGKTTLQIAGFYNNYRNLQVSSYKGPIVSLVNAARARTYGAEAELSYHLSPDFQIDAGVAYVNGRYRSFPGAPLYAFDPAVGITITPGDASGKHIVISPEVTANFAATFTHEFPNGKFLLNGNVSYRSKQYFDAYNATEQSGYALVNARVGWTFLGKALALSAYVKNLTNKAYITEVVQQPVDFASMYGTPRTFGIELKYSFR